MNPFGIWPRSSKPLIYSNSPAPRKPSVAETALSALSVEIEIVTVRIDELTRRKEKIEEELAELSPIASALTQAQNTVAPKGLSAEIESALVEGLN